MYGNRTFRKGGDDEKDKEERLLKRLVIVANAQNKIKMKREVLVAAVGRKEDGGGAARIRVRVRVGGTEEGAELAKKKRCIGPEEALSFLGTNCYKPWYWRDLYPS